MTQNGPTGFTFSPATGVLGALEAPGTALAGNVLVGTFTPTAAPGADTFTYTIGGLVGTTFFSMSSNSNHGLLSTRLAGVPGSSTGTLYALTVQINDTSNGTNSGAKPFDVVVGDNNGDTINLATGSHNLGISAETPTFVYGRSGADTISASGMTGPVWIAGGAGADTLTGGSGPNTYLYGAAAESTPAMFDTITNFHVALDRIDLSGIGLKALHFQASQFTGSALSPDTIAWQVSGANTFVYVNTSSAGEPPGHADMEIVLNGKLTLTESNFVHH
jgi:hypothetical protein